MQFLSWIFRFFDQVVYGFCMSVVGGIVMNINGPCEMPPVIMKA